MALTPGGIYAAVKSLLKADEQLGDYATILGGFRPDVYLADRGLGMPQIWVDLGNATLDDSSGDHRWLQEIIITVVVEATGAEGLITGVSSPKRYGLAEVEWDVVRILYSDPTLSNPGLGQGQIAATGQLDWNIENPLGELYPNLRFGNVLVRYPLSLRDWQPYSTK